MLVHPIFWLVSVLVSAYVLYLAADWQGRSPRYALVGLVGFPGLVLGLILIFTSRAPRRATAPGAEPLQVPPEPAGAEPFSSRAPGDEREQAVREAERILDDAQAPPRNSPDDDAGA